MKTFITLLLSALLALPSFGQKRTVDVGSFSELGMGIPGTLYIKQGSSDKVEIECDDDIFDEIEFEMSGNRLSIKKEGKWDWRDSWKRSEVTIYVTMKNIEELAVSGSGNMESEGQLKTDDLKLAVSGSGSMDLNVTANDMDVRISGSGSIKLSGEARKADTRISGSGRVKAEDMTVSELEARISGSGSCYITATDEIDARISGSGSVYYAGNPKRINSESSGSGKVRKMQRMMNERILNDE